MAQKSIWLALWTLRAFFAFTLSITAQATAEDAPIERAVSEPKEETPAKVIIVDEGLVMDDFLLNALSPILKLAEVQGSTVAPSIWDSILEPDIPLEKYISRFRRYAKLEASVMLLTIVYIDRFTELTTLALNRFNIHRIFLLANVLAQKYLLDNDDLGNSYMARIGGLTVQELNELEREFLKSIDYQLYVSADLFQNYVEQFLKTIKSTTSKEIYEKYVDQLLSKSFI